jgi:hypothetical protein
MLKGTVGHGLLFYPFILRNIEHMMKVYKYKIAYLRYTIINIPNLINVIKTGRQDGEWFVWCEVGCDVLSRYEFSWHATGAELSTQHHHVYTEIQDGYVWHLYYKEV